MFNSNFNTIIDKKKTIQNSWCALNKLAATFKSRLKRIIFEQRSFPSLFMDENFYIVDFR